MASTAPRSVCRAARLALPTTRAPITRAPIRVPRASAPTRYLSSSSAVRSTNTIPEDSKAEDAAAVAVAADPEFPTADAAAAGETEGRPRWSYTPPAMKAPFSLAQPKKPSRSIWRTNDDPEVLDQFYVRFLGPQGPKMLPEELKWLAVTHKSFDQGRRGFNDKLAYFGRQAIIMEVTRDIITSPVAASPGRDTLGREPFQHPSLATLERLNEEQPADVISKEKMQKLAMELGLLRVLRWKPRLPENLAGSGVHVVCTGALQAIIGAISLQHGAEVASRVIKEKLLNRLRM